MKVCLKIVAVLLFSMIFSSYVFAESTNNTAEIVSKDKTIMSLVSNSQCDISFGTYGKFQKKLVNIDEQNKTIDISLTASNTAQPSSHDETIITELPGEVVFLIDSSTSMDAIADSSTGKTRKETVIASANALIEELYALSDSIKIGVAHFSSDSQETERYGTSADAQPLIGLTTRDHKDDVTNAVNTLPSIGVFTDLDVGLKTANSLFSDDATSKKYLIVLTDGVPNLADGIGEFQYSNEIIEATTNTLSSIKNSGINILSLLINIPETSLGIQGYSPEGDPIYRLGSHYTGNETEKWYAEQIFGSRDNPKYGVTYYVEDAFISSAIETSIYHDLITNTTTTVDDTSKYVLTDITIKDYFPDEIVNNFSYSVISQPSKGTISDTIDSSDKSITWSIPQLAPQETTTLQYRLTLNDNVDVSILNKNIKTNKDVTIDYTEDGVPKDPAHNDESPVIKLEVPEEPTPPPAVPKDDTTAPNSIPQAGSYSWLIIGGISLVGIATSIFGIIKSVRLK